MSRIDDLIALHWPNGVEFKLLGEVGEFIRGNGLQKSDLVEAGVGAIHYGQIHTHYDTWTTSTKSFVNEEIASRLRKAKTGNLVIATTSEDDEAVAKAVAWLGFGEIAVSGDAHIYRHTLDPKYVSYFFQSAQFQDQKKKHITGLKVRRISGDSLAKIRIPVPPLEIQRKIVKILDTFADLTSELKAELKAELEARQRQYRHYRDVLLAFRERTDSIQAPIMTLTDIATNLDFRRRPVTKSARATGKIPYYGASGIVDYVSDYIFNGDYLLISEDGANLLSRSTPIAFSVSGKSWVNNHAHVLEFKTYAERRFVEFYLNSIDLSPFVTPGAQPKLSQANLNKIPIPVPPLEEQERTVAFLDRFDALKNSLSEGLPREIELRQKQYEYFRDLLFSFSNPVEAQV